MGCCPDNVNPIPPTVPPPVVPPPTPIPPDYVPPQGFVDGVDQMIFATEGENPSYIRLITPQGGGNNYDGISKKDSTVWFEFDIPEDSPYEYYLSFNFVEFATPGSGGTDLFAKAAWQQENVELYRTINPSSQLTITASTNDSFGDAHLVKGKKMYYKIINANPNVPSAGFRLSWKITKL